ncbi:hypothetical protein UlMin_033270 [Ulmus minor]
MASVSLRHVISATHPSFMRRSKANPENPVRIGRFDSQIGRFRFSIIRSKKSDFQDFQDYAKPAHLLPVTDLKVCTDNSAEKLLTSFRDDTSNSLYKVKLETSNFFSSSLSDLNAGILLCLIDEHGDSVLQRISASYVRDHSKELDNEVLHFQRGSVDEFIFEGPKLGRVEAVWIGLDSGQWRLGSLSLIVIDRCQPLAEDRGDEEHHNIGVKYDFQVEDILIGEGSNVSMVELRPHLITRLSGIDLSAMFTRSLPQSTLLVNQSISNEESMREYSDLKLSLLLYDAILIFIGTSAASFSAGEHAAYAFLGGGVGGFLYLLLLQRSVDGLSAPALKSQNTGRTDEGFGGFKGPISSIALAIGFALIAAKYSSEDFSMLLTPKEIIVGMMGFLACKVAVVLAAFKPLEIGLRINK